MVASAPSLNQEQSYALLSKTECLFAGIWHSPEGTVETKDIAQYYEVSETQIFDILQIHHQEFDGERQGDRWTPRAAIRIGMLLNSPMATNVRSLALDVIEAQKCKSKKQQITYLLQNSEFVQWSDREIGRILECSRTLVGQARKELLSGNKIIDFQKRKFNRGGKVIEQSTTKESGLRTSSGHELTDESQNPDSIVTPKVKVSLPGDPRDGMEVVVREIKGNSRQMLADFPDGTAVISIDRLDAPSSPYTPVERRYPKEYEEAIAQLKEQHQKEIERLEQEIRSRVRQEEEQNAIASLHDQLKAAQDLASAKALEAAKLQRQLVELESLRQLEEENQRLNKEIEHLKELMRLQAESRWENTTITPEAAKSINARVEKMVEDLDPDLHLKVLATTPPSRDRYNEVAELLEKAADLLEIVPRIGRRVEYQGHFGTLEDVEGDTAVIDWDKRNEVEERLPLTKINVLPTIEGIAKGSFVGWADSKHPAYHYKGEVLQVCPRTKEATIHWTENGKTKAYPVSALRLIRGIAGRATA